jgi:hypothetical protein
MITLADDRCVGGSRMSSLIGQSVREPCSVLENPSVVGNVPIRCCHLCSLKRTVVRKERIAVPHKYCNIEHLSSWCTSARQHSTESFQPSVLAGQLVVKLRPSLLVTSPPGVDPCNLQSRPSVCAGLARGLVSRTKNCGLVARTRNRVTSLPEKSSKSETPGLLSGFRVP